MPGPASSGHLSCQGGSSLGVSGESHTSLARMFTALIEARVNRPRILFAARIAQRREVRRTRAA